MLDSQKILLIVSYLLRYPDQQWRSEFPSWKWEAENSVQHQLLRESLIEFFEYVEETGLIDFENQYVESFDFSKNTTLYMSGERGTIGTISSVFRRFLGKWLRPSSQGNA